MKVLACLVLALLAVVSATEPEKRALVGLGYGYPVASAYSSYVAPVAAAPLPYVTTKFATPAATVPIAYSGYHYSGYPYTVY